MNEFERAVGEMDAQDLAAWERMAERQERPEVLARVTAIMAVQS